LTSPAGMSTGDGFKIMSVGWIYLAQHTQSNYEPWYLSRHSAGLRSGRGLGIFLFTASRTTLGPTQPPIQWVPGVLYLGIKRPGREADHSPPSGAEVKECVEIHLHSPHTSSRRGAQLKHRNNFTFTSFLWMIRTTCWRSKYPYYI
jgi:hypothetical protein